MPSRHVLLIAGNERRFIEDVQKLADFLAPSRPRLTRIHAAYWEERAFARAVEAAIAAAGRAPLIPATAARRDGASPSRGPIRIRACATPSPRGPAA